MQYISFNLRHKPLWNWMLAIVLAASIVGCATSGETAVVTQRPEQSVPEIQEQETQVPIRGAVAFPAGYDTVQAGRFDTGRMWTFDNPPLDYFEETYGFRPDNNWLERARMGALRFATYCSASFVSPNGLVMTNHHCGRESVTEVSKAGEDLLENGFYATSLELERKVPNLFIDQLIEINDVTDQVYPAIASINDDDQRAQVLSSTVEQLQERLTSEVKTRDTTLHVQVIELYSGGQFSAYTFKRYNDVRLVMAPELKIGYFGGDPDNFTYPRYTLDMSFFRVYGEDGQPLQTENYFEWSDNGAGEGEVVFAVGNPGSTERLNTVAQLEYERDFSLPDQLAVMRDRAAILKDFIEKNPEQAEEYDIRNAYFSLENSIKATTGQLRGLQDPYLIARRAAAERNLMEEIAANDSLRRNYGDVIEEIARLQKSKEAITSQVNAFTGFGTEILGSHILLRGLYGYLYSFLKSRFQPQERLDEIRSDAVKVKDWPKEVEKQYITSRFRTLSATLGASDPTVRRILRGRTPEEAAEQLVENTALADSAGFVSLLDEGYLGSSDPSVEIIEALAPLFFSFNQQIQDFDAREQKLNADLARARFAVYGTTIPPDASFSLRLADGVVSGYTYNGTVAPAHTTFYGLYSHYYSYGDDTPWDLPEKWLDPPETFDLSTPLNMVSTVDITGGNSGSPLLNRDLEIVGLIFDGNIESLPNDYLYLYDTGRAVAVDSRGIVESLDDIYDADRIVVELKTGQLAATEEEADAMVQ